LAEAALHALADHVGWVVTISALSLAVGVVAVPALVVRVRPDYFLTPHRPARFRHPLVRVALSAAKNCLGAALLAVGILLLFLPGQGLLTLIVGLMIMDYPGKYKLERWLVRRPHVLPALNWLRRKHGRPPLQSP
jgi:hypothetical protein